MNYYIVVEGKSGEKRVYPKWIGRLNPTLRQVHSVAEISTETYFIVSGNGYPGYLKIIDNAIEDFNAATSIDLLVIAVDAEDQSCEAKKAEILSFVGERIPTEKLRVIVQFPCLENWALGNRVVCRKNPENPQLRKYLRLFDVRVLDPEVLPPLPEEDLNRCQFAFVYLKRMLNDRHPKLTYTKSNPVVIEHEKFFAQMKLRLEQTAHIQSFDAFFKAFAPAV